MDSRERVRRAIKLESPDRIPLQKGALPAAFFKYGDDLVKILREYPDDFTPASWFTVPNLEDIEPGYRKGTYKDIWGCVWENTRDGMLGQVVRHPLEDWRALSSYRFPKSPWPQKELRKLKKLLDELRRQGYFTIAPIRYDRNAYFERLQYLRGFENLLIDLVERPPELEVLLDKVLEINLRGIKTVATLKPDAISFMDDWGTQRGLMISPRLWREIFKPRYRKMVDLIHESGSLIWFHSDGQIMEIVDDLVEIGIDALNPQFSCMDLEKLGEKVRGKLCIVSDPDRQQIMPYGSPREVREYIEKIIRIFHRPKGGLIASYAVAPDIPLANARMVYKVFAGGRIS